MDSGLGAYSASQTRVNALLAPPRNDNYRTTITVVPTLTRL
jgi:hypothetical protein